MLNQINEHGKLLLVELLKEQISLEEFKQRYPVPVTDEYITAVIQSAIAQKSSDELWLALSLVFRYELIGSYLVPLLEQVLLEDWHSSHEDIVWLLQQLKSASSVPVLFKAATMKLAYLEEDEFFALARKCLWALGSINTAEARKMIEYLANSDNEIIREHAQEQIKRIKTS